MDLDRLEVFDGFGPARIRLTGEYTPEELADRLVQSWIPFFECHRCGRFSHCEFVQRKPDFPSQAYDIQCGVAVAVINNFVKAMAPLIPGMERSERQDLLDAAFYLVMFIYDTELRTGQLMSENLTDYWGSLAPSLFTFVLRQRETLDKLGEHLAKVPGLEPNRAVVLVEGESERALIAVFQGRVISNLEDLVVVVYGGRGSRGPSHLRLLLDQYRRRGYPVLIQVDRDGGGNPLLQLVNQGLIESGKGFSFAYDLETSVPAGLMYASLSTIGETNGLSRAEYEALYSSHTGGFWDFARKHLSEDLPRKKVLLAETVGVQVASPSDGLWGDERFMESELGQFLDFLWRSQSGRDA